jgi:hypothetical protein
MRYLATSIIAGVSVLGLAASANAALIGLSTGTPDVTTQAMEITYTNLTSSTGTFTALGTPVTKNPGSVTVNTPSSFSLTVNITHDVSGNITGVTSGSLAITGDIGSGSTSLFNYSAATAPQFGFSTSSNTPDFDVLFPTGGTGALDAGSAPIGLILHAGTSITNYTTNLFSQSFSTEFPGTTSGPGSSDTFAAAVPEPASLAIAAVGMGACLLRRRRKLA